MDQFDESFRRVVKSSVPIPNSAALAGSGVGYSWMTRGWGGSAALAGNTFTNLLMLRTSPGSTGL
ncbi:MAG: hypothetical protein R3C45_04305 [Phycisphaerales bacterium]